MTEYQTKWTIENFEIMGWHDSRVYSVCWDSEKFELTFDIDYIFEWINKGDEYEFIVSPVTLKFHNVWDIKFEFEPQGDTQINDISRVNPVRPRNYEFTESEFEWDWDIDLFYGNIYFKSVGYTQIIREQPIKQSSQSLSVNHRKELQKYLSSIGIEGESSMVLIS